MTTKSRVSTLERLAPAAPRMVTLNGVRMRLDDLTDDQLDDAILHHVAEAARGDDALGAKLRGVLLGA